jgi:crotonobetainyl-CoA:carnitine CoA-transferase CaiB-like acyl-CoA transferase
LLRGEIVPLEHFKIGPIEGVNGPGMPIPFSRKRAQYSTKTAELSENNAEICGGLLGYSDEDQERLREEGAI